MREIRSAEKKEKRERRHALKAFKELPFHQDPEGYFLSSSPSSERTRRDAALLMTCPTGPIQHWLENQPPLSLNRPVTLVHHNPHSVAENDGGGASLLVDESVAAMVETNARMLLHYIRHLVKVNQEKEGAVERAKGELELKQRKLQDEKEQQDPSEDPESTTSSLMLSSEPATSAVRSCDCDAAKSISATPSSTKQGAMTRNARRNALASWRNVR